MPRDDVKSATDNSLVRIDAGNGGVLQSTEAIVDDSGNMTVPGTVSAGGHECVTKEMFNANTILAADSDNTPAALSVAENTVVARAEGNIRDISILKNSYLGRHVGGIQSMGVNTNCIVARKSGALGVIGIQPQRILGRQTGDDINDLTAAEVADILAATLRPAFISGRWYNQSPGMETNFSTTGAVLDTDTIVYYLLKINQTVSFDALGLNVTAAEAGKNARVGIFASDATPQPTTLLAESGNLSLAAAVGVSDPVTETKLIPGLYWWAINADSTTAAARRIHIPGAGLAVLGASAVGAVAHGKYTEAQALGAFPATATPVGPAYAGYVAGARFQVV